ncbi:response regulator [Flavivirga eckloniae]|uniref:Transcriptional regulator n=1 Tax=Flavivirga eckloniae TaxID=1803846 RepID=A0A2K9PWC2_9FLAO|nr:response regulator [Flavivirga eckloniae]AUP81330.1 transcriptional regulator [Flavivirga eckloniae]
MKKVLLIEDDTVLKENTLELLELSNYEVITAPNGEVGVDLAVNDIPDVIVCDIMMPEMDGYRVFEILSENEKTKYIPFIFLSAKAEHTDIRKGMNMGADDYITKPFSEEDLICTIESRLAKASILKDWRDKPVLQTTEENQIKTLNDLKNFFDDNGKQYNYNSEDIVYNEGDHSNFIYLITKGLIKTYKLNEQGKELTTALYKEDDLFGYTSFAQNIPYRETAKAIKDSQLAAISKSEFRDLLDHNHEVAIALIQLLTDNLAGVKNQLLQMAYSSVNKKTAKTLVEFAKKMNRKPEDPIKISRSDLASVAGIATETLIRTMTNFKKQGLIDIEGRHIKILDLEKLQQVF